jgi:hypothetical protein
MKTYRTYDETNAYHNQAINLAAEEAEQHASVACRATEHRRIPDDELLGAYSKHYVDFLAGRLVAIFTEMHNEDAAAMAKISLVDHLADMAGDEELAVFKAEQEAASKQDADDEEDAENDYDETNAEHREIVRLLGLEAIQYAAVARNAYVRMADEVTTVWVDEEILSKVYSAYYVEILVHWLTMRFDYIDMREAANLAKASLSSHLAELNGAAEQVVPSPAFLAEYIAKTARKDAE